VSVRDSATPLSFPGQDRELALIKFGRHQPVIDANDVDDPLGVIDAVDHPVCAPARGMVATQFTGERLADPVRVIQQCPVRNSVIAAATGSGRPRGGPSGRSMCAGAGF
jgi:hypothetical protein